MVEGIRTRHWTLLKNESVCPEDGYVFVVLLGADGNRPSGFVDVATRFSEGFGISMIYSGSSVSGDVEACDYDVVVILADLLFRECKTLPRALINVSIPPESINPFQWRKP